MENIIINSSFDNYPIHILESSVENPKGVIQMIHGMEEYKERYLYLINKFNEAGYSVVISDIRGHGKHLEINELGYFSKRKPQKALVIDQETILEYIKENYNDCPIYLFAHSMGTMITRNLLQKNSISYSKVILCGAPVYNPACRIGSMIASTINLFKSHKKGKFLFKMTVKGYSKKSGAVRTKLDWLSYNEQNIDNYLKDPYCGFKFTNNAFMAMIKLMKTMDKKIINKNTIPNLLVIAGDNDPVPGYEKGIDTIIARLKKAGYNNIEKKIIPHARHEIINEDSKDSTIEYLISFYQA